MYHMIYFREIISHFMNLRIAGFVTRVELLVVFGREGVNVLANTNVFRRSYSRYYENRVNR